MKRLALAIAVLLLACDSSTTLTPALETLVPTATPTEVVTVYAPAVQTVSTETPVSRAMMSKIGERIILGGIGLTINKVWYVDKFQHVAPNPGNHFLIADVTLENASRDEKSPYDLSYFTVEDGDGSEYHAVNGAPGKPLKSGDLVKGQKVRGTIAFEVPASASSLVLKFKPALIFENYGEGEIPVEVK